MKIGTIKSKNKGELIETTVRTARTLNPNLTVCLNVSGIFDSVMSMSLLNLNKYINKFK